MTRGQARGAETHLRIDLPIMDEIPPERADAARNRQKIVKAAASLVTLRGADALSFDEVAHAANVGVGTVYRRFSDVGSLVAALIDEREKEFQRAFMSGPPPMGPGAPAAQRLTAFLHGLVDHFDEQLELLVIGESKSSINRYSMAPHRTRHIHLVTLLRDLQPQMDVHYIADALLGALSPSLISYQRRELGMSREQIKTGITELLCGILR